MLSKKAVRRLTKLADYMDSLPPEARKHFHMSDWFKHDGLHPLRGKILTRRHMNDCGTTACALGWAATMPAFQKLGLTYNLVGIPWQGFHEPIGRAMKIFDIDDSVANDLFSADLSIFIHTPKQWARYCRQVIRKNAE